MKIKFDLDGTLCNNTYGKYEEAAPFPEMIKFVNELYDDGHQIIIETARGMKYESVSLAYEKWYNPTMTQLQSWGVKFHELILGKIEADIYIDDRAIKVNDDGSSVQDLRKILKGINIVVIPLRSGSKSIPNKNIKDFCGRPLMAWTIEAAKRAKNVDKVVAAIDNEEYAKIAQQCGAEIFWRSTENAKDDVHAVHCVLECLRFYEQDNLINNVAMILATSPLTIAYDIETAFGMMDGSCEGVLSVTEFDRPISCLRYTTDENLLVPISEDIKFFETRRQDVKKTFEVNGSIFVSSAKKLKNTKSFHSGKIKPYVMAKSRSVDINEPDDWVKAEMLMQYYLGLKQ